jgi:tRNA threonylcarbamoyl adenosine modification protein YeaZ
MKTLALEFSSGRRSTAVVWDRRVQGEAAAEEKGTRATRAFDLIEGALRAAQARREEIECLAVGLGPGSYTGVRVAIAVAQGWQLARGVKLLGLSSAEGVAAGAWEGGLRGRLHVALDAHRQEAYTAAFEVHESGWREVSPLTLVSWASVRALAQAGAAVIGPELQCWGVAGQTVHPSARQIGLLAEGRTDFVAGEDLAPIYLRPVAFVKAPPPRWV